jgi:hypothetical protein
MVSSLNSDEILQLNEEHFKVTQQEDGILSFEYSEAAIPALDLAKIKAIRILLTDKSQPGRPIKARIVFQL